MPNLAVVALARLVSDRAVASAIADNWKISNDERAQLLWTVGRASPTVADARAMVVEGVPKDWIVDLAISRDEYAVANEIAEWVVPTLPINGNDVIAAGVAAGPKLGRILREAKNEWVLSGYTLSREELLGFIETYGKGA